MALPTGPIPRVAFEEYIEESWGDSVAQSLNNLAQAYEHVLWTPTSELFTPTSYSSTGDLAVWFRVGGTGFEVTVPDWAERAIVNVQLNGLSLEAVGDGAHDLQVQIGPETGRRIRRRAKQALTLTNADDREWFGVTWTDWVNVSAIEGDRALRILAGVYGSPSSTETRWRADTYSDIAVFITYAQDAINFYGSL